MAAAQLHSYVSKAQLWRSIILRNDTVFPLFKRGRFFVLLDDRPLVSQLKTQEYTLTIMDRIGLDQSLADMNLETSPENAFLCDLLPSPTFDPKLASLSEERSVKPTSTSEFSAILNVSAALKPWDGLFAYRLDPSQLSSSLGCSTQVMRTVLVNKMPFGSNFVAPEAFVASNFASDPNSSSLLANAISQFRWQVTNRFCTKCGQKYDRLKLLPGVFCSTCRVRRSPQSAIVECLITDPDNTHVLLSLRESISYKGWKTVTGFSQMGETPEETAKRLIAQTLAIEARCVSYIGLCRFWPFTNGGLRFGCIATVPRDAELDVNLSLVWDAKWFSRTEVSLLLSKATSDESAAASCVDELDDDDNMLRTALTHTVSLLKHWHENSASTTASGVVLSPFVHRGCQRTPFVKHRFHADPVAVRAEAHVLSAQMVSRAVLVSGMCLVSFDDCPLSEPRRNVPAASAQNRGVGIEQPLSSLLTRQPRRSLKLVKYTTLEIAARLMQMPPQILMIRPMFVEFLSGQVTAEGQSTTTGVFLVNIMSSDFKAARDSAESLKKRRILEKLLAPNGEFVDMRDLDNAADEAELTLLAKAQAYKRAQGRCQFCVRCGSHMITFKNTPLAFCDNKACGYVLQCMTSEVAYGVSCLLITADRQFVHLTSSSRGGQDSVLRLSGALISVGETPERAVARFVAQAFSFPLDTISYTGICRATYVKSLKNLSVVFGMEAITTLSQHELRSFQDPKGKSGWYSRNELLPLLETVKISHRTGSNQNSVEKGKKTSSPARPDNSVLGLNEGTVGSLLLANWLKESHN